MLLVLFTITNINYLSNITFQFYKPIVIEGKRVQSIKVNLSSRSNHAVLS